PAAHHLALEVGRVVLPPDDLAGGGFEAREVATDADDVQPVAVAGRRPPRALVVLAVALLRQRAERRGPGVLAGRLVEGPHDLLVAAVAHAEDAAGGDRNGAVAAAEVFALP